MSSALIARFAEMKERSWRIAQMREQKLEQLRLQRARKALKRLSENPKDAQGLCLVYGNCKAEATRVLLDSIPGFPYRTLALPPVYEITAEEAEQLRAILPYVAVWITHPVKEGYRGMGLGSDSLSELVTGQVIRMISLRFQGCFPFLEYVQHDGHVAPITVYDDLRFLACASRGWTPEQSLDWMREYTPPSAAIRQIAADSIAESKRREDKGGIDVGASDLLEDPAVRSGGFFTMNHPSRVLLDPFVGRIAKLLGIDGRPTGRGEPLGQIRPPIEASTYEAQGLAGTSARDWTIYGQRVSMERLVRAHLAAYAARPELIRVGIEQHRQRMAQLELI